MAAKKHSITSKDTNDKIKNAEKNKKKQDTSPIQQNQGNLEDKKKPEDTIKKEDKESISNTAKIIIGIVIIAIALFLIISFNNLVREKSVEDRCKAIENHPYLNFECRCAPLKDTEEDKKNQDTAEKSTSPLCRCTCDIGNGTLWSTDIRVSE